MGHQVQGLGDKQNGRKGTPWKRVSAQEAEFIRETLAMAGHLLEPEEQTQREVFGKLMPDLYVLRHKGYSFRQIAALLNASGLQLQPGTVRTYYWEMIQEKMEMCQQRLDEQMLLLREVEKLNHANDSPKLIQRIAEIREQQRKQNRLTTDQRVSATLNLPSAAPPVPSLESKPALAPSSRPPAAVPTPTTEQDDVHSNEFGLLGKETNRVAISPGGGFFHLSEDAPQVPSLVQQDPVTEKPRGGAKKTRATASRPAADIPGQRLKCRPLQEGIKPLTPRDDVDKTVYSAGALEHPAIPGLLLALDERLYGALLEYADTSSGEVKIETMDEKRYRMKWQRPRQSSGSTSGFTAFHPETMPGK